MPETIKGNFSRISDEISETCHRVDRAVSTVELVVVTKGQPPEKIDEVLQAGAVHLGENYPEETMRKIHLLRDENQPTWHMIGHIQSRKIKLLLPHFSMIHSVDSVKLAQKLNNYFQVNNVSMPILIEVNLSGEISKYGFDASSKVKQQTLLKEIEQLIGLKNLAPSGLMTMPPDATNGSENRRYFSQCRELQQLIQKEFDINNFSELSMGTSTDYKVAIEEGATLVRIGEAIMGKRVTLTIKEKIL